MQADTKGPKLMVKDPQNLENLIEARLIVCMDDHSRYVTGARYVLLENEEWVMAAIATYGVPDILYVDLGSPYIGHSLLKAAALVGCHVLHTPRADASAKRKEANECLAAFISQHYHVRVHSSTGERPIDRYAAFPEQFVSERTLALVFFKDEFRGEAYAHTNTSDWQSRQAELEKMGRALQEARKSDIPPAGAVPSYSFLERRLVAYRLEKESWPGINAELSGLKVKKEAVRATLAARGGGAPSAPRSSPTSWRCS